MAINVKVSKIKTDTRHDVPNLFLRNGKGIWHGESGDMDIIKLNDTRLVNAIIKVNKNVQLDKMIKENEAGNIVLDPDEIEEIASNIDQKTLDQAAVLPEMLIEADKRGLLSKIFV